MAAVANCKNLRRVEFMMNTIIPSEADGRLQPISLIAFLRNQTLPDQAKVPREKWDTD
jgi:hypothetical protein